MKPGSWVLCGAAVLAGCSIKGTPTTAWGKSDVSMADYRTDASECTLLAVTLSPADNGASAAAGVSPEMTRQRARQEALESCLTRRGYTEFVLTSEQRATLSKLPQGSDQRREYLYGLGIDPQVLATQAVPRKAAGS